MKRVACHLLYFPSGESRILRIIDLDASGLYAGDVPLDGEKAGVLWLGGVCVLLPQGMEPRPGESVAGILTRAWRGYGEKSLRLWQAC
ncbi:MAG: hypothetical protein LUC45_00960 [Paraprevotella sp.]|nr:hypothetical protein [Paraprevotella sp.]